MENPLCLATVHSNTFWRIIAVNMTTRDGLAALLALGYANFTSTTATESTFLLFSMTSSMCGSRGAGKGTWLSFGPAASAKKGKLGNNGHTLQERIWMDITCSRIQSTDSNILRTQSPEGWSKFSCRAAKMEANNWRPNEPDLLTCTYGDWLSYLLQRGATVTA